MCFMKDFVGLVRQRCSKKNTTKRKSTGRLSNKMIFLGAIFSIIIVFLVLIFRVLPWADIFSTQTSETVLFVTQQVDQMGAFLVRFNFTEFIIDVYPINADLPIEILGGYGNFSSFGKCFGGI